MKKNSIWIISWTLVNILFSIVNQYILTTPNNTTNSYGPIWGYGSSIHVFVGGPILGLFGAIIFLLIDSFTFRKKIKDKYILFFSRITLVIFIVLLISLIKKQYF